MRCPFCGKDYDPREGLINDDWREIFSLLPSFEVNSRLIFEYCECFGISPMSMRTKKLLRLLTEMSRLYQAGRFTYRKRIYDISNAGLIEAIRIVCDKNFPEPLDNHNYLKKVMLGISEKEGKTQSIEQERTLRRKEEDIMTGKREEVEDEGWMSAAEFKRIKGVESLVDLIGSGGQVEKKENIGGK